MLDKIKYLVFGLIFAVILPSLILSPFNQEVQAAGASLTFSPNHGNYIVGSTFEISLRLNTNGEAINTIEANIVFPPEKIQVVFISKSLIEIWVAQPSFSNAAGTISLIGGIPSPGINTSAGIITTITFRAKSAGKVKIQYDSSSKVLKNDGNGTNILTSMGEALIDIIPAPPGGPIVSSKTHDDQNKWYRNQQITFNWDRPSEAIDFSYVLDNNQSTIPDTTIETTETTVSLTAETDGLWYFHIRGKDGVWGGTTHYLIKIDSGPPAKFTPVLQPSSIDINGQAILTFRTTDGISGIDRYEVKLISSVEQDGNTTIFTEQTSPYVLRGLNKGNYKIIVRAIDNAGNSVDGEVDLRVTALFFGVSLGQITQIIGILLFITIMALLLLWRRHHHHYVTTKQISRDLADIRDQMEQKQQELKTLRQVEKQSVETIADLSDPSADIDTSQPPSDKEN